ncbi:MAG: ABC transporter ATP-binding protein [Planctomycetes bacterium]|nr:ABC transporter ATP-binding protein [Planctomycetota bacterium]
MRVELRSLGKRFGKVVALRDVVLDLPAGGRTALIGPNGSGKSTLVRLLMGMLDGDGDVVVDGTAVGMDRRALAPKVAYVPQIAPRLAAPVRDVVRAAAGLRGRTFAQVAELAAALHLDLQGVARQPFRTLSGGQRQKVLAALALSSGAEFLLLDEPTASMDPRSRLEFFRLVEALPASTSVLLCSHRLDEIRRLVDRVVVLAEGVITWQGTADAWLQEHAEATIEVRTDSDVASAWLQARGFLPGATGWWNKALPVHERAHLLAEIGRNLNGQVRDLMARDSERVAPEATERGERS